MAYEILTPSKPAFPIIAFLLLVVLASGYLLLIQSTKYTLLLFAILLFIAFLIDLSQKWIKRTFSNVLIMMAVSLVIFGLWLVTI